MKTNDYIKYMTQEFVSYIDQPKEDRKAIREEKRKARLPKGQSLFGLLPIAISQSLRKWKR